MGPIGFTNEVSTALDVRRPARCQELARQDLARLRDAAKAAHAPLHHEYVDSVAEDIVCAVLDELMKPSELRLNLSIEAIMEGEPPSSLMATYLQALKDAA